MDNTNGNRTVTVLIPSLLFAMVAVIAFCTWAFGGGVFKSETTLYSACAIVFLGLGGLALFPYSGIQSRTKMAITFALGFALYSIIWTIAWFAFRNTFGEVLGSFAGLLAMMLVFKKMLKLSTSLIVLVAIAFLWHTLGYYAGGYAHKIIPTPTTAKLAWGAFYGLGMGLGLSQAIQLSREA